MAAPDVITVAQLAPLIGTPDAPIIIDVRVTDDRARDPRMLPASRVADHRSVAIWAADYIGKNVVVVCQQGLMLGQRVAAWLRHEGARAESLEGGFEAWAEAGSLRVRPDHVPPADERGRTLWVTRSRPKIDHIACPCLIRRFVDPRAVFLFVAPAKVAPAADRFGARYLTSRACSGVIAAKPARVM